MALVLFDNQHRNRLLPLVSTRAIAELRVGIFTRKEWWQHLSAQDVYVHTLAYLQALYPAIPFGEHIWIDASILVDADLYNSINSLSANEALQDNEGFIAGKLHLSSPENFNVANPISHFQKVHTTNTVRRLQKPQDLFLLNAEAIKAHVKYVQTKKISQPIPASNQLINPSQIFIEEGAIVEHAILNASTGPIYIGKNATIMEGCLIRGPLALCDHAILKMGTKIYGATTIGVQSVAGGEIKNTILGDYSNKAHDGYLGDSVVGQWCNFGAGTSNSNVKNTGGDVLAYSYASGNYENMGAKCGLVMGDYTRTAINTSINTGSVIGVCCHLFGEGLLPKTVADFTWGTKGLTKYELHKALLDVGNWKKMKGKNLTTDEAKVLEYIFGQHS
jgi:UDP-N-acetylglucosamine diphosphorylase/glucosamine-1-phosphate N-acetyltransferase